ncbi:uncharacterized protein RCC_05109 [Ramularia collo-cygni]|uniref:F-box domain-containing protein n=1 Tax=Ramularia collo-cygni TaxID=112498 RepID=A0A2D3VF39_9PEZI|nr:uncharacterized protein RCC_05109 [Ramularia collo-cygni]CZT19263.1 uncharacterized protein RCC_05109 [Ramularia collo-cygni]
MLDQPFILQLPVEVLSKIARHASKPTITVRFQPEDLTPLLHFRQTCKTFERAAFDILIERFPRKLRCSVGVPRNVENFKAQSFQKRLTSRLRQVTLSVDILAGSNISDIKTAGRLCQHSENAQLFDFRRLEADFYDKASSPLNPDLQFALQQLQPLATPPAIKISVWLSEDVYLENHESKNVVPMLSSLANAIPPQMLRSLELAYAHCDAQSMINLVKRSLDSLEEVNMDNVSFVSSTPRWVDFLKELTRCTKLKNLLLCNLREESLGAVLSSREPSSFSPFSFYLYAGFSGRERVKEGLRALIEADLCTAAGNPKFDAPIDPLGNFI